MKDRYRENGLVGTYERLTSDRGASFCFNFLECYSTDARTCSRNAKVDLTSRHLPNKVFPDARAKKLKLPWPESMAVVYPTIATERVWLEQKARQAIGGYPTQFSNLIEKKKICCWHNIDTIYAIFYTLLTFHIFFPFSSMLANRYIPNPCSPLHSPPSHSFVLPRAAISVISFRKCHPHTHRQNNIKIWQQARKNDQRPSSHYTTSYLFRRRQFRIFPFFMGGEKNFGLKMVYKHFLNRRLVSFL